MIFLSASITGLRRYLTLLEKRRSNYRPRRLTAIDFSDYDVKEIARFKNNITIVIFRDIVDELRG